MKALLLLTLVTLTLTSCGTNWQALGLRASNAALDATIPVLADGLKQAAKQPVSVRP